jgi:hypothetical protein
MESIRYNVYMYIINCSLSYIRFFIDLKCQPRLVQMSARAGPNVSPGAGSGRVFFFTSGQPRELSVLKKVQNEELNIHIKIRKLSESPGSPLIEY